MYLSKFDVKLAKFHINSSENTVSPNLPNETSNIPDLHTLHVSNYLVRR